MARPVGVGEEKVEEGVVERWRKGRGGDEEVGGRRLVGGVGGSGEEVEEGRGRGVRRGRGRGGGRGRRR